ncbi:hypothetical protein OEZ86_008360 [Tetradesmus obliquus]|nr:hypothetical protein OEZ86_008360 [Tetradesmus obliquus]
MFKVNLNVALLAGSLVAHLDLVCSSAYKVQLLNTILFVGCFFGSGIFGLLCDKIGRRLPLFIATAAAAASMFASLAVPASQQYYWAFALTRAVAGVAAAGQSQAMFLLVTEVSGPSHRGIAGTSICLMFTLGEFVLVGLAWALPHWRNLTLAAGLLTAGSLLLFPWVPESARWLLSKGQQSEATQLLHRISISNGTSMPAAALVCSHTQATHCTAYTTAPSHTADPEHTTDLIRASPFANFMPPTGLDKDQGILPHIIFADPEISSSGSAILAFRSSDDALADTESATPHSTATAAAGSAYDVHASEQQQQEQQRQGLCGLLCQPGMAAASLVLLLTWFTIMLSYYGVALGLGGLPGSLHVTFSLGAAAELAGVLQTAAVIDKVARHCLVAYGMLLAGASCLAAASGVTALAQCLLAAGKFGCTVALIALSPYTSELFPTSHRATAMGIFAQAARIGSIAAPSMIMLGSAAASSSSSHASASTTLPYTVFGAASLLSGLLMLLLPNTRGAPLPETAADLKRLRTVLSSKPSRPGLKGLLQHVLNPPAVLSLEEAAADRPLPVTTSGGKGNCSLRACHASATIGWLGQPRSWHWHASAT